MQTAVVRSDLVVLPGRTWLEEPSAELGRLGVSNPEISARKTLQHICARAGCPQEAFLVGQPAVEDGELARVQREAPEPVT